MKAIVYTKYSPPKDLIFIKELLEAGKVAPVIDTCYPLHETAEAVRYLVEGHAQGKVIITVEQSDNTWLRSQRYIQLEKGKGTRNMDKFPPYDPREPHQQQQQAQWQAPQSYQWQPEWQARPYSMPPQYTPYPQQVPVMAIEPQKSWLATVLLCQFLGTLGIHRFYTGRIISGIFQLLTFGGFGIWVLIDLIMIVSGDFKDQYNRPLDQRPVMGGSRSWVTAAFLCLFLGWLGVHRFYTGRVISGIFQLLTFGGFGIWAFVDLIMIYTDSFTDDMGQLLTRMERVRPNVYMYTPQVKD